MKKATKFDFKTLLVLLLSLTLCLSMVFAAACSDAKDSSSSSSSSTEEETYPTDYQQVTNGDFEFSTFTKKKASDYPVSSSIGWTLSRNSTSSNYAKSDCPSGIIDTNKELYNASEKNFSSVNPKTPFDYEGLVDSKDYIEADAEANDDGLVTKGSKILMIHNRTTTEGRGTAQKFTSSKTLSLSHNEYAELSVWVLTRGIDGAELKSLAEGSETGAYVAIQNTISSTRDPFIIKNINTKGEWVKYTVYLSASDFATSSFKVVLGLGFGQDKITNEYVEGYAFFDNVNFKVIDKKAYDEAVSAINGANKYNVYNDSNELVAADALIANECNATYLKNEDKQYSNQKYVLSHTRAGKLASTLSRELLTAAEGEKNLSEVKDLPNGTAKAVGSISDAYTACGIADDKKLPEEKGAGKALYFNYAANAPTTYSYTTAEYTVKAGACLKLSFWVKAEVRYPTERALTVTLNDLGKGVSEDHIVKTTIADNVNTKDYENDNYNGWCEYIVYVNNTSDYNPDSGLAGNDRKFTLTFDFGITSISDYNNNTWNLTSGYAIIAGFDGYVMTEEDYNIADTSSYSYAKKVTLSADLPNGNESKNTDSYNFSYSAADNVKIKTGVASNVLKYSLIKGNSKAAGNTGEEALSGYGNPDGVVAGLINTEYTSTYADAVKGLERIGENTHLQPLLIDNTGKNAAYGYMGQSATLSANTTTLITVKVYVTGSAVARIYLVNSDALDGFNTMQLYGEGKENYTAEVKEDFVIEVTAADCVNGWFTATFCITTGNEAKNYRPEFWIGDRNSETATEGVVYFDSYTVNSSVDADALKAELANKGDKINKSVSYKRLPTTVKYTNEKNKEVTKDFDDYDATPVYEVYRTSKAVFATFATIDVEHELDKTSGSSTDSSSSSSSETSSSTETSFNWALQITSIIIAAILIVLLAVVLIKMIVDKNSSKKHKTIAYYDRDSRDKAHSDIKAKKVRNSAKSDDDSDATEEKEAPAKEYDYDNMENNVGSDEATEETTEAEIAEETGAEEATDSENNETSDDNTDNQ